MVIAFTSISIIIQNCDCERNSIYIREVEVNIISVQRNMLFLILTSE